MEHRVSTTSHVCQQIPLSSSPNCHLRRFSLRAPLVSRQMTTYIPLDASSPFPSSPSFLATPHDSENQLSKVLKAIMKAKRIVVVCGAPIETPRHDLMRLKTGVYFVGAGISVQAGIPDFRSPEGLFQTLKRDNPRESLTSGKDLFDASVFNVSACSHISQALDHLSLPYPSFVTIPDAYDLNP